MLWVKIRSFFAHVLLYCVVGAASVYFMWHALNGERGLKTREEYQARIEELTLQKEALQAERQQWEHRVNMVRSEAVDRDLLDEEVRIKLGRLHKNDVVIFLGQGQ